jgi:indole-3-glycerol phosphate synthase/phosphoribosylanthranilate isomerase
VPDTTSRVPRAVVGTASFRGTRKSSETIEGPRVRFAESLRQPGFGAIAEFKRRSPSAGDLRPDGDVIEVARSYERAGARAISVLVDEAFGGSWEDVRAARTATSLPLLAKGFFSTTDHLRTAAQAGADAALLILRDLDDAACASLMREAERLGLDTLVEAHDAAELDRASALGAPVIGVNARDLSTFELDRGAQLRLLARAPHDRILIAESAIATRAHGAAAELTGANAILVGSTLMRAPAPGEKLAELIARPLVKVCGLTRQQDVDAAVEAGADLLGFILARESPRRTDELLDAPDTVLRVAVFVGDEHETGADLVQFYAHEHGHRARDGVLRRAGEQVATVVDLPWETGDPTHLERARAQEGRVMLAGGLSAANVGEAIAAVSPWAVDSARSTEREPGVKDHEAVRDWVTAAGGTQ